MKIGHGTHVGKTRKMNQDAYWVGFTKQMEPIMAVADGLGGHRAGDVASRMLMEAVASYAEGSGPWDEETLQTGWVRTIKKANREIFDTGRKNNLLAGMGTTLTLLVQHENKLYLFHIGDSRAYRLRENTFEKLTKDHTLVEQLLDSGEITLEEAKVHPNRNMLMRAVGTDETVEPDVIQIEWRPGDLYLLCSDGLTNYLGEDQILQVLTNMENETEGVQQLIEGANAQGGGDNITAILYKPEVVE